MPTGVYPRKPVSEETRKRISIALTGKKGHPAWNKGLSIRLNTGRTHFKKGHVKTTEWREFMQGREPWNKNLTKETSDRVAAYSKKLKGKKRPERSGKNHFAWKGDEVGYFALHVWVVRNLGRPSGCEHCGTTEKRKYEWANRSHEYKRDLTDWIRLCVPCHKAYDKKT